jgi:hypothetical protein
MTCRWKVVIPMRRQLPRPHRPPARLRARALHAVHLPTKEAWALNRNLYLAGWAILIWLMIALFALVQLSGLTHLPFPRG